MIDITECAACGRTIPATTQGCAYCDSERSRRAESSEYTPMLTRWALVLFGLTTALSTLLGLGAFWHVLQGEAGVGTVLLAAVRVGVAAAAGWSVSRRRRWAVRAAQLYVGVEVVGAILNLVGLLPQSMWSLRVLTPLWAVVFGFFFWRRDVRATFDPAVADRAEVAQLLDSVAGSREKDPRRR